MHGESSVLALFARSRPKYRVEVQLVQAVRVGFINYANFSGRSGRASYWYWALFSVLVNIATYASATLNTVSSLVLLVPSIAVGIRRMHDIDRSGWWMLAPLYNIILACQPGTMGLNRFGPPEPPVTGV